MCPQTVVLGSKPETPGLETQLTCFRILLVYWLWNLPRETSLDVDNSTCSTPGVATSSPRNLNCRMNNLSLLPFLFHSFHIAQSSHNPWELPISPPSFLLTAPDPPWFCSRVTFVAPSADRTSSLNSQDADIQPAHDTWSICARSAACPLAGVYSPGCWCQWCLGQKRMLWIMPFLGATE